ncbi:MAG: DUF3944 domain-containing protein [Fibrobacter sp.]|nr:DUF3944 domain-containing protein [Fibrobacter sp.]
MAYREDADLEFLSKVSSEDLNDLVLCLTKDKDGETRFTEELTFSEEYKKYYPDHHQYWRSIAAEIQCFGANSFVTMLRGGKGVCYKEVLTDVCDKLKANYNEKANVERIEDGLLMKICADAIDKMTPEQRKELAESIGLENTTNFGPEAFVGIFQAVFTAGGFKSYQLTLIVVNAVVKAICGRGIALAGNAAITRVFSVLTGPIGWVISGLWTIIDIAGPAYRVTLPAVVYVALLRKKYLYNSVAEKATFS